MSLIETIQQLNKADQVYHRMNEQTNRFRLPTLINQQFPFDLRETSRLNRHLGGEIHGESKLQQLLQDIALVVKRGNN